MFKVKSRFAWLLALVVIAMPMLAACGGETPTDTPVPVATDTPAAAPAANTPAAEAPTATTAAEC